MDPKPVITILDNEIAHLSSVFSTYKRLYRTDDETCELLSQSDGAFFKDLYIIYLNYISVAVSRLLDPEKTGKKSNLTIFTLISILKSNGDEKVDELHKELTLIKERAYNFTEPRNQLVSHLDYDANKSNPSAKSVPSFIVSEFDGFYRDIGILMNKIRESLGMLPNMYEWGITGHGSGQKLISRLNDARKQNKIANKSQ